MQVPVIAKADSMTLEELRQFRKYIRSELEQVLLVSLMVPPTLLCPH
jgi:septin family protein